MNRVSNMLVMRETKKKNNKKIYTFDNYLQRMYTCDCDIGHISFLLVVIGISEIVLLSIWFAEFLFSFLSDNLRLTSC